MRDGFARLMLAMSLGAAASADAATVGIYHPYVNANELEVEYGLIWRGIGDRSITLQRASIGYSWTDRFATEIYLLDEFASHDGVRARAYELEARWQLTEQGEYASDWGLLVEAQVGNDIDRHELAAGVLWEKELRHRWVAAANAVLEYEFGNDIGNEFETAFRGQVRYLHSPALEPAIELYLDDIDYAAGPALQGQVRLAPGRLIRWQFGLLLGLDRATPSRSARFNLEIEL